MLSSTPLASGPPEPAVLLVLLPEGTDAGSREPGPGSLTELQRQLGPAIRVLRVDEGSHPAVVRSFQPDELPALVLVQQGVELWRQPGLPEGDVTVALLLSKIGMEQGVIPQASV
jgi:hypothetical protein